MSRIPPASFLLLSMMAACAAPAAEPGVPPNEGPAGVAPELEPAPPPTLREGFVVGDPSAEGIDAKALASLIAKAKSEHSEALVIVKNGKLVYEDYFGADDAPILAMSASKSFVSLAFGILLADGKLGSLDEPVAKALPDFASSPRKAKVTYRQMLSHTSGIDPTRADGRKGDIEAKGMAASCVFEPGTSAQYSNGAVDMLGYAVGKLAGKRLDAYLDEKLFAPLGIGHVEWVLDSKGVPLAAGEMRIRPLDLAKVGQLVLDGGMKSGTQVVPAKWLEESFAQSSSYEPLYGLLWWRDATVLAYGLTSDVLMQWRTAGLNEGAATKLEPLIGRRFPREQAYVDALRAALTMNELTTLVDLLKAGDHIPLSRNLDIGPVIGVYASGWLGQFLVIVPEKKLAAVRMRRARQSDVGATTSVDNFRDFPEMVGKIAP